MTYSVILFDLDDTLIDFAYSERMGLKSIHEKFYPAVDYQHFTQRYKEINTYLWNQTASKENAPKSREIRTLRFLQLNEQLPFTTSADEVAEEYDRCLYQYAHWLPDVQPVIEFLHQKGHILGIITNGFGNYSPLYATS
ncbi:MAG: HAD family hydrolase [Legionella sp.]